LVIHLNLKGIDVISENDDHVILKVSAGENWHRLVLWCLEHDYGGIENLSLIPGNVGAAPIQNIGAYGAELKDVFVECEALHLDQKIIETFSSDTCDFGYRNSTFKKENKGKYVIISVSLKLSKKDHEILTSYGSIQEELKSNQVENPTIQDVSNAVIAIRSSKLPDPNEIGNSGSFFKNPVISAEHYSELKANFSEIPCYPISESEVKIPAGWLIEKSGFKGKKFGDYGVHEKQALVLVNYGDANGQDIYELSKLIQNTIKRIFDINLEAEVNII